MNRKQRWFHDEQYEERSPDPVDEWDGGWNHTMSPDQVHTCVAHFLFQTTPVSSSVTTLMMTF